MKFLSSAKINLNLEVNSETKDGLHTLTSYLIPIDFYDVIEINETDERNDKIIFTPDIELKGKSTIEKSLDLVRESNSFEKYFEVKVTKKEIKEEKVLPKNRYAQGTYIDENGFQQKYDDSGTKIK